MMWGNTHTIVLVNDTRYDLELHEKTNGGSTKLSVLNSKPRVEEVNINDKPTRKSNSFAVKFMATDGSYGVLLKKRDQPMRQLTIPLCILIDNQRLFIRCDKGKLHWHEDKDNDGTTDSKNEKKQQPNDPNGEHQTKQVPKDVIRSLRKTRYQLLLNVENFQDTILQSERGSQESIEPNSPKNVTPREDQKKRKNRNSSNTFDRHGTTDSKGTCEKEYEPNDPDGEHPPKRTKAKHDDHDVKQSHTRHEPIVPWKILNTW
ncbi:unnamed protein product [Sphagnum balticum]